MPFRVDSPGNADAASARGRHHRWTDAWPRPQSLRPGRPVRSTRKRPPRRRAHHAQKRLTTKGLVGCPSAVMLPRRQPHAARSATQAGSAAAPAGVNGGGDTGRLGVANGVTALLRRVGELGGAGRRSCGSSRGRSPSAPADRDGAHVRIGYVAVTVNYRDRAADHGGSDRLSRLTGSRR